MFCFQGDPAISKTNALLQNNPSDCQQALSRNVYCRCFNISCPRKLEDPLEKRRMLRVASRSWCFLLAKALQPQTFAALLGLRTSQAKQNGRGNLRWLCAPASIVTCQTPSSNARVFAFWVTSLSHS